MIVRLAGSVKLHRALTGLALAGALALSVALAPAFGAQAGIAARADAGLVTVDIAQPAPNNGLAEGPVGANLIVQGKATAGDAITLGIAPRSASCTSGFQSLNVTTNALSDGSFTTTFAWPQTANNVGDRYYVCAQDTTASSLGASTTLFQVDSADPPQISVQQVSNPTAPTAGPGTPTPTPPNPPDGTLYAGGYIEVKGQNFTPGGTQIQILVTPSPLTPATASAPSLQIVKGAAVTSHSGAFDVVAQLPSGQTGQFYISATSSDGTSTALPSLVGSQSEQIALAPTPTPLPTPSPSPSPSPTAQAGGSNSTTPPPSNGPSIGQVVGAIVLGLFSAIFFILGVAMLISASGMSGGAGGAPGRPQPR